MARGHGGLPDEQQGESGIVERLKQVLDRPAGQELEAEPRKAVAGKRRGVGESGKPLGEAGGPGGEGRPGGGGATESGRRQAARRRGDREASRRGWRHGSECRSARWCGTPGGEPARSS